MVETCSKYAKSCGKDKGNCVGGNVETPLCPGQRSNVSAANAHGKGLQQGASNVQDIGLQQGVHYDAMPAEAATAGGEWETMKKKQKSNRHHKKTMAASVGAAAPTSVGADIAPVSGVAARAAGADSGVAAGADSSVATGAEIIGAAAMKHVLTVALDSGNPVVAAEGLMNEFASVEPPFRADGRPQNHSNKIRVAGRLPPLCLPRGSICFCVLALFFFGAVLGDVQLQCVKVFLFLAGGVLFFLLQVHLGRRAGLSSKLLLRGLDCLSLVAFNYWLVVVSPAAIPLLAGWFPRLVSGHVAAHGLRFGSPLLFHSLSSHLG
ncbi:hypothetical protein DKX38_022421 [Salix brachista]|uniref:Uncharacterized protein n=1 Tax=Salix brachista TaxID=2182728 RepID=A0A5N5K071_9ROSI|nr:hypothetical protein DKX38_022421 [Salix brachista]